MIKQMKLLTILSLTMILALLSCGQADENDSDQQGDTGIQYNVPDEIDINYDVLDNIDISGAPYGIVPLPEELGKTLNGLFVKYTKHVAPNGKPIHIFAQGKVTDLQLVRAREILALHLRDVPGTKYGSDKSAIANEMGDVRATLTYTETEAHSHALRPILNLVRRNSIKCQCNN